MKVAAQEIKRQKEIIDFDICQTSGKLKLHVTQGYFKIINDERDIFKIFPKDVNDQLIKVDKTKRLGNSFIPFVEKSCE